MMILVETPKIVMLQSKDIILPVEISNFLVSRLLTLQATDTEILSLTIIGKFNKLSTKKKF